MAFLFSVPFSILLSPSPSLTLALSLFLSIFGFRPSLRDSGRFEQTVVPGRHRAALSRRHFCVPHQSAHRFFPRSTHLVHVFLGSSSFCGTHCAFTTLAQNDTSSHECIPSRASRHRIFPRRFARTSVPLFVARGQRPSLGSSIVDLSAQKPRSSSSYAAALVSPFFFLSSLIWVFSSAHLLAG